MTSTDTANRRPSRRDVDDMLIAALVIGMTYEQAARHAGCSLSTVNRRVAEPEFRMRLVEAKGDAMDRLLGTSIAAAQAGTRYLLEVVQSADESTTHRVRAAIALRDIVRLDQHLGGG